MAINFDQTRSVRTKILLWITLLVMLLIGFQFVYFSARQTDQLNRALTNKGRALLEVVAYNIAVPLDLYATGTVGKDDFIKPFKAAAQDKDVQYVALYAEDGKLIADVGDRPHDELEVARMKEEDIPLNHVERLSKLLDSRGTRGLLVLFLRTDSVESERASVRMAALLAGLGMLLFGLAAALSIAVPLGRRLQRIERVAATVAEGDLQGAGVITDDSRDELGRMGHSFNAMLSTFRQLEAFVSRVASGDLSHSLDLKGDLVAAFNRMVQSQRELVQQINDTSVQLNSTSGEFFANAQQQEHGATEQSSAVEETRRTMDTLLESSRTMAKTAQSVLQNAERSQANSQVVAERIAALSQHTRRITEILEVIKDIANKSDLLALNAALEGTKAGEAGRGFSLVAAQMQRLAENVMGSVRDIKELTATITESTQATVIATEESTKLSADTTRSVRQISLFIQQQQSGTEQVTKAMDDVALVAGQTASGSKQIVSSAEDLMKLSERMQSLVGRFGLKSERKGAGVDD